LGQLDLLARRDELQGILQAHWPTVGWDLHLAKTGRDLSQALKPIAQFKSSIVALLIVELPSGVQDRIGEFRSDLKKLYVRLSRCRAELNTSHDLVIEARDSYTQARARLDAARDGYVAARKGQRPAVDLLAELKNWSVLCNRLRVEIKQREERVDQSTHDFRNVQTEIRTIEAYFAQTELLRFLKGRRYAFTPENVANAASGLPELGCRRSFLLCSRVKYAAEPSINYIIFEALSKILKRHSPKSPEEAATTIRREIGEKKQFANIKGFVNDRWHLLEDAMSRVWASPAHPHSRAFKITSLFLANLRAPRQVTNSLLDAIEKGLTQA
jgi:hypothetical protein